MAGYGIIEHITRKQEVAVYLKKSTKKSDGRTHLSICHNYHEGGRAKTRTVQTLGYVDVLKERFDDPVAHFSALAAQMEAERKAQMESVSVTLHMAKRIKKDEDNRKNLGFCVLSKIFHELACDSFFANRQTKRKIGYSLGSVMKLLVYSRILDPGSKRHDFFGKEGYFERFKFTDDDIYRALPVFARYKDELLAHLHRRMDTL